MNLFSIDKKRKYRMTHVIKRDRDRETGKVDTLGLTRGRKIKD